MKVWYEHDINYLAVLSPSTEVMLKPSCFLYAACLWILTSKTLLLSSITNVLNIKKAYQKKTVKSTFHSMD